MDYITLFLVGFGDIIVVAVHCLLCEVGRLGEVGAFGENVLMPEVKMPPTDFIFAITLAFSHMTLVVRRTVDISDVYTGGSSYRGWSVYLLVAHMQGNLTCHVPSLHNDAQLDSPTYTKHGSTNIDAIISIKALDSSRNNTTYSQYCVKLGGVISQLSALLELL